MASLKDRMVRAAMLDVNLYEEVEADTGALGQAMAVVIISSVAAGIGSIFSIGFSGIIYITIFSLISWFVWAFVIYLVGTKMFPESETKSDHGELLRTIGFASSPGVIRIFGIIPFLGWLLSVAASIWMLIATVIAVRQALDYKSTARAILVCIIGWIIQWILLMILFGIFGIQWGGRGSI